MRKNFGAKAQLYPMPVLIIASYDKDGTPDAMNAAWGGISGTTRVSMCLGPGHKTVKNIIESGAFTVSVADATHLAECDYVGLVSANDVPDKLAKAGLHAVKSEFVNAPIIEELKMTLECTYISFDEDSHVMTGEIVNVSADESILGDNGEIDPAKIGVITFDPVNHTYIKLGDVAGKAFEDGKKIK